jgi:type I restriction enzyme M protein
MAFSGFEKINAAQVKDRMLEISPAPAPRRGRPPRHSRESGNPAPSLDPSEAEELAVLEKWLGLSEQQGALKKQLKEQEATLDKAAYEKYSRLTTAEIKTLVVEDKWLAALLAAITGEVERVSQVLTTRVRELALRYESPLPALVDEVAALSAKVDEHLRRMGVAA